MNMAIVPAGHGDVRNSNRRAVLREIVLSGPVSRTEIAGRVELTAGAVSRIARPLIDAGLVREIPEEPGNSQGRPGRRFMPLELDPQGGQVLGIGIGPTFQTVVLADLKNRTIAGVDLKLDRIEDPDLVVRRIARECRRLIGAHLRDRSRLLGGLLMVTGPVDPVRGDVLGAPSLGWGSFPLRARLADLLELPVKIQSMTTTIAHSEMLFGETRGRGNVLTLLCGLGISAAMILDGRLVEGGNFPTGRIGDTKVMGEDGAVETLDELVTGLGVLRRLHGNDAVSAGVPLLGLARALLEAIERDRAGDPDVALLLARAGRELGRVIVQSTRFVAPETVLIAGPLSMSPSYMAAVGEGMAPCPAEVIASGFTGSSRGWSACCAMAICEYLLERPLNPSRAGTPTEQRAA